MIPNLKLMVVCLGIVACLSGLVLYQNNKITRLKTENTRVTNNFYNLNQELDSVKNRNGTYHYTVETLELTKKELERTNGALAKQINQMRLKIKNLESVTQVNVKYIVRDSIVYTERTSIDSTFISKREDDWLKASWKTTLHGMNKPITATVSDFKLELYDSIITPVEIEYKGWWIFKRPKGVKIHVQSLNPYSKFDKIEYIKIK